MAMEVPETASQTYAETVKKLMTARHTNFDLG